MGAKTGIEWTGATWNPLVGCTKVSQGCKHCYAKTLHDKRHRAFHEGKDVPAQYAKPFETIQLMEGRLDQPLHWRQPRRIFVNSVSDLFHEDVPEAFIHRVFRVMRLAHWHTFQVLTKRAERMQDIVSHLSWHSAAGGGDYGWHAYRGIPGARPLPNVWLGVSVEDQKAADARIPHLLHTPAAVRFLSCEPLLGPLDLYEWLWDAPWESTPSIRTPSHQIGWVIDGGESGPGYRPADVNWFRDIRDQCLAADVPYFHKQQGGITPKANGKALDGVEHCAFPEVA